MTRQRSSPVVRLASGTVGEAHDDGRGDDLSSRRNPRSRPGGEHPEVGQEIRVAAAPEDHEAPRITRRAPGGAAAAPFAAPERRESRARRAMRTRRASSSRRSRSLARCASCAVNHLRKPGGPAPRLRVRPTYVPRPPRACYGHADVGECVVS